MSLSCRPLRNCIADREQEPVAVSDTDRKWVIAMREAFADPTSDVNLPQDYFRRLCDIALRDPAPARSQDERKEGE